MLAVLHAGVEILMIALLVTATCLPVAIVGLCVFALRWQSRVYRERIAELTADNVDLRSRLFIQKGLAPVGVNVTEQYEERKQAEKEQGMHPFPRAVNPLQETQQKLVEMERVRMK